MHVEAMGERKRRAGLQIVLQVVIIDRGLMLVGCQHHDDVGPFGGLGVGHHLEARGFRLLARRGTGAQRDRNFADRSEEHTSELQSLMRTSYAVFCLKKKKTTQRQTSSSRD